MTEPDAEAPGHGQGRELLLDVSLQASCRPAPSSRELAADAAELPLQRRLVGLQGSDGLLAARQAGQLGLGPLCEGHDLLDGAAVLPLQGEDHAQTLLDLSEPPGVVLDAVAV